METKKYIIHWLDGYTEEISGTDIPDAFYRAGYGGGAVRGVDYFEKVKDDKKKHQNKKMENVKKK